MKLSSTRSRSQPAGVHAFATRSECALRLCLAGSVACASEFKPLARPVSAREREPRERGPGLRVPVCVCGKKYERETPVSQPGLENGGRLPQNGGVEGGGKCLEKAKVQRKVQCKVMCRFIDVQHRRGLAGCGRARATTESKE